MSLVTAQGAVLVLGYVTHPILSFVLGVAAYGVYGVVLSIQSIVGLLLALGIPVAVSRYVARDERTARSTLRHGVRLQTGVALLVAVILWLVSPWLARVLRDGSLTNYFRFSSLVIFSQAYYPIYVQYLSGMHRFNRQAALTVIYAVVKLLGALGLIFIFGVYGAFAGFAAGGMAAAAVGWYWARQVGGDRQERLPHRAFLEFAGTYVAILVGLQILISLDLFMVKALLRDDVSVGYYTAAVTLSRIPYLLLQGLAFILLPSVSALTKPGKSAVAAARFIADSIRYLIALIVPSVALAAATSKALVTVFYQQTYEAAASSLTVLMVGLGCLAFYLLLANIVAGAGRARVGLYITLGLIALSGALGVFLIPEYGLLGAAWQTTIAGAVGLAGLAYYTFRVFHIPFPIKSTVHILIAAAVAVAPTYLWHASLLTLALQYLLSGVLYMAMLVVLREITVDDRRRVASLHPSLRRVAAWGGPL